MTTIPATLHDGFLTLSVRLTPNARQEGIEGVRVLADGKAVLAVRVRAVPEDGAANAALIVLLAKAVGMPKSRLQLVSGQTQRLKVVRIEGGSAETLARLLS